MNAMLLDRPMAVVEGSRVLRFAEAPTPDPAADEVLIRVNVCAVCRTDLDIAEGRLRAPRYPVIPGHQVVGRVAGRGRDVSSVRDGDRVGVAWIHWACGVCRWCRTGMENLCPQFNSTGCDVNGGYAEYVTVPANFAHAIPESFSDASAAPLLCAGAIGWRSLRLTNLVDGSPLGLTGFGASAHLVLQLARHRFPNSPVYVFARNPDERSFALTLGAAWAGDVADDPPERLAAIIDTTPAWTPIVESLRHLAPGGRLVINAIRKENRDRDVLVNLDYVDQLWMEREIKSVANVTRADVREFLEAAESMALEPRISELPLEQANEALVSLRSGGAIRGAKVLRVFQEGQSR
jgi:propanol-preferring alcohol dehydrogenase